MKHRHRGDYHKRPRSSNSNIGVAKNFVRRVDVRDMTMPTEICQRYLIGGEPNHDVTRSPTAALRLYRARFPTQDSPSCLPQAVENEGERALTRWRLNEPILRHILVVVLAVSSHHSMRTLVY